MKKEKEQLRSSMKHEVVAWRTGKERGRHRKKEEEINFAYQDKCPTQERRHLRKRCYSWED